jgi:hypothetical protein
MFISTSRASVGGYAVSNPDHDYGGRVYETAVWNIPATRANIEAKMAPILGLLMPGGTSAASFTRDREGYYPGAGAAPAPYHTAWKHQPRIDPAGKGLLFGLQATNRVPYPEALPLWTRTPAIGPGSPTVTANNAAPPGDADINNVARILLPAGSNISVLLDNFGDPGAVHGQIWLQRISVTGTLTISSDTPGSPSPIPQGSQGVDLAGLTTWTQVQITGLTTDGAPLPAGRGTLYLNNNGGTPIEFYAWGVVLTQLGRDIAGGGTIAPLGFNPGPTIYNSLIPNPLPTSYREKLLLPPVTLSTAASGFCIGAEGQPATDMTWAGPFRDRRTLVEWLSGSTGDKAKIMVMGPASSNTLRFNVQSGVTTGTIDVALPANLLVNTSARIKGCVAANGDMALYVNDIAAGTQPLGAVTPDLSGGSLSVGSDHSGTEPWHGYVKAAVACRNGAPPVAACQ